MVNETVEVRTIQAEWEHAVDAGVRLHRRSEVDKWKAAEHFARAHELGASHRQIAGRAGLSHTYIRLSIKALETRFPDEAFADAFARVRSSKKTKKLVATSEGFFEWWALRLFDLNDLDDEDARGVVRHWNAINGEGVSLQDAHEAAERFLNRDLVPSLEDLSDIDASFAWYWECIVNPALGDVAMEDAPETVTDALVVARESFKAAGRSYHRALAAGATRQDILDRHESLDVTVPLTPERLEQILALGAETP